VSVLESNKRILVQIRNVSSSLELGVLLENHPAHVGEHETSAGIIGILISISESVVGSVTIRPPLDGALGGTRAEEGEEDAEGESSAVSSVSPQTVVSGSDTKTGEEIVGKGPDGGLEGKGSEGSQTNADKGDDGDNSSVEPVNMLRPIGKGHWQFRNVLLLSLDLIDLTV